MSFHVTQSKCAMFWDFLTRNLSGTALGVPLNNGGKPHLKPATKPKYVKPNHAGD
jgi:hypothetical protein